MKKTIFQIVQLTDTYKHKGMRRSLVDTLRAKGISDEQVLASILQVPRHYFMDSAFLQHAYQDKAFPIGEGQTISQPFTVAYQTQLLEVKSKEKILEIGTGSGYQTSLLLALGANVVSIEINPVLHQKAAQLLKHLPHRAQLYCADGSLGWTSAAPFDKILVTAGAPSVPTLLAKQLKIGGKMVIPVGTTEVQQMLRITRTAERQLEKEFFHNFSFVPLLGEAGWH